MSSSLNASTMTTTTLTLSSGFVKTYTPTVSSMSGLSVYTSATGYYTDMSAMKTAYGTVEMTWLSSGYSTVNNITQGSFTITLPAGVFSNVHSAQVSVIGTTGWGIQWGSVNSATTSSLTVTVLLNNGTPSGCRTIVSWYVVGN